MKWFSKIIALYLLVILGIPCSDGMAETIEYDAKVGIVEDHSHEDSDHCTPFCHCRCCGFSSIALNFHVTKFDPIVQSFVLKKTFSIQNPSFVSSYFEDIWQPPQLNV